MSGTELCRAMKPPVLPLASKVGLGLDDFNPFYTSEITKLVEYDALYCTACTVKIVRLISVFKNLWNAWRCKKFRNALNFVLQPHFSAQDGRNEKPLANAS